ncbi:aldo-keto reductase family 1 member C15-like [Diorhabda sublineata]|uniref:aldo-keto reductase family 1 member C15-like n=1 Tax=Diorhabda sublineata TaxID=1163346 RepID=UPI0024E10FFB|nr:aldo-keto reductase family 1 member C15-like [Diorhabda sublineata]
MTLITFNILQLISSCLHLATTTTVPYKTMLGGYRIPALGYGTFTVRNETELTIALNEALRVGYRHIDTAQLYENEHIIGKVLTDWFTSGRLKREDLFVTTKIHLTNAFPHKVEKAVNKSLTDLRLDYIDLLLIHCPISFEKNGKGGLIAVATDHIGTWKKMEEQVNAGLVRSLGLSNFNISQIDRIRASARIQPANLQIEVHPYFQEKQLRDYCKKHNIVVVAYSSLGAPGVLTFFRDVGWKETPLPSILTDSEIVRISKKHNKTPAQVALRFIIQLDLVAIPKSTNAKRIKENMEIFDFVLDDQDMEDIEKLEKGIGTKIIHMQFLAPNVAEHPEYPFTELLT